MTPPPPAPEPSAEAGQPKPKVIYVMGSGRSGSTILGVALGNCEGVFFVGELDRWLPSNGTPVLGGTERTRFWNRVRAEVEVEPGLLGPDARDTLERALGPLRFTRWPGRRRLRLRWRSTNEQLYRAIARVAGATHIVDTSHFPLRARELKAIEGIEVYLLFLVRDPQAILASFTDTVKRDEVAKLRRRILATNANLWITHLLGMWVFLGHAADRRLFMRYEDFTADPQSVLRQVLDLAGSTGRDPGPHAPRDGLPDGRQPAPALGGRGAGPAEAEAGRDRAPDGSPADAPDSDDGPAATRRLDGAGGRRSAGAHVRGGRRADDVHA